MKYQSSTEVILEYGYSKIFHDIPIMWACLSIEYPPHFYWRMLCPSPLLYMMAIWVYVCIRYYPISDTPQVPCCGEHWQFAVDSEICLGERCVGGSPQELSVA